MAASQDIWIFSEKTAMLGELITAGREMAAKTGGQVVALVLGPRAAAEQSIVQGAERVLWLGELHQGGLADDYVPTLAGLLEELSPYGLLVGATRQGKAVAGRLAARLGVTVLTDVLEFMPQGSTFQARHMIFGGGAVRVDQPIAGPLLATIGSGVFHAQPVESSRTGEIREVVFVEPSWHATLRERKPRPVAKVNLAGAKRVVCAGRGLAKQDDLVLIDELAQCLSAEVACTRPLAEGLDWLPRERYIGISGATVRPDLYFGVGVSGQVQHLIGMSESRLVVAINKDENAPIFQEADYGIAGDLYALVPALIKVIKERR
jgi:electron transfer flavoprotein alpha subunit